MRSSPGNSALDTGTARSLSDYPPVYTRVRTRMCGVLGPLGGQSKRLENFRLAAAGTGTRDNWISPRQLVEPRAAES
eukprot:401739-Hanusia_phi.AAC.1